MSDKKITDMTALAAGSQATGDLLAVVDVSEAAAANKNKKITMENLFKGIPGNVGIGTSSPSVKLDVRGGAIFNEDGSASHDFRIESNNQENCFFVDASADRVGIRTNTPDSGLDVNADLRVSSGTNSSLLVHFISQAGGAVFNEAGASADFRVEGNTNQNLLFVDGSADRVGIGTATPGAVLDVNGNTQITGNVFIRSGSFLHLANSGNTNNVRINADDATSDYVITLPPTAPTTDGHVLSVASGGGTADVELEWAAGAGSISPLSADLDVGGFDIISTSNGNIDLTANGTGLIRVTENSLSQVPIVTQHDIGTAANEIPLNQHLGTAAFVDTTQFGVGQIRAWINFDGTSGSIGTGRASANMDDVTDNGTGDYTVNFTNDMPDTNYCAFGASGTNGTTASVSRSFQPNKTSPAVGSFRFSIRLAASSSDFDDQLIYVCIVR